MCSAWAQLRHEGNPQCRTQPLQFDRLALDQNSQRRVPNPGLQRIPFGENIGLALRRRHLFLEMAHREIDLMGALISSEGNEAWFAVSGREIGHPTSTLLLKHPGKANKSNFGLTGQFCCH